MASDRAVPARRPALQLVYPAAAGRRLDSVGLEASRVEAHPLGRHQVLGLDRRPDLLLDLFLDLAVRQPSPVTSDRPAASGRPVVPAEALDRAVSAAAARLELRF